MSFRGGLQAAKVFARRGPRAEGRACGRVEATLMLALWLRLKLLWGVRAHAARVGRLFLDRRVSPSLKVLTGLGALLVISPIDLLGDIPILGALDDVALLALLAMLFVRFCPPEVVAEYSARDRDSRLKNVTST